MGVNPTSVRVDPFCGYNFLVVLIDSSSVLTSVLANIQNTAIGGFSECGGLETTLEVEEFKQGGDNGTVLKFPTRVSWTSIRLKRGVTLSDELWNWYYSYVEGKGKRRDGIVVLQNELHVPVKAWQFVRGLPVKWTGPTLNAAQSEVAVEELEIAHEGMSCFSVGTAVGAASG
jgi:phage tail-like protein